MTVTDNLGETDTATADVTIGESNRAPTADAGGSYSATVGEPVAFDGGGSTDSDGKIDTYRWDFGDASDILKGRRQEHTYDTPGTYTATLEVKDDDGATDTDETTVVIGSE